MVIKVLAIIIIVIVFAIVFKYYVLDILFEVKSEPFTDSKYKPANTRIAYYNIGDYPWNRHTISSSIPYDIKLKDNNDIMPYYEFDNDTYNKKLKEVFNSSNEELIIAMEGTEWSHWNNPKKIANTEEINKLIAYYELILSVIYERLQNNNIFDISSNDSKIQIVHDLMKRYKYNINNREYNLFDVELILYRDGKVQGKHVKLFAITDGKKVHIIAIRVIGVISEDNIMLFPYVANDTMNSIGFDIFIPEGQFNTITNHNIDSINDSHVKGEIEDIMYKKLLENYDYEESDISNNSYNPEKKIILRDNFSSMVNNIMEEK